FRQECEQVALGMRRRGILRGERIAILSKTRYEWTLVDMAIIGCGGVTVPIYPSSTPSEVVHLLDHSDAKMVFVEDEAQLMKILSNLPKLPKLEHIVLFESAKSNLPSKVVTLFE